MSLETLEGRFVMHDFELSMQAQYKTISLEAIGGESSLQRAISRLPSFFKTTKKHLLDALSAPIDAMFPQHNLEWAAAQCIAVPYQDMRTRQIPCVPGIKTDYLTYSKALAGDAMLARTLESVYLDPFIQYLSARLNGPDTLRSVRPDSELDHFNKNEIEKHSKETARLVDPRKDTSVLPYGKLIRRNADWSEIVSNSRIIHDTFTQSDHVQVSSKVERCSALLGMLFQHLTADHDAYKISAPVLKKVVDASYICALAVEFYGLSYRRALVYDTALDRFIAFLKS